jgi:broad specificity phosphatase PhoE
MDEIIYIRHGQAETNTLGPDGIVGSDFGLTPEGRLQAEAAAGRLTKFVLDGLVRPLPDVIYSSPYIRARETADIIATQLDRPVEIDYRLKEIQKGAWHGRRVADVMEDEDAVADDERHSFRPPEGENWFDVADRMVAFIAELEERGDHSAIVVSHNHPIEIAIGKLTGLEVTEWKGRPVDNASISRLVKEDGYWKVDEAIFNNTSLDVVNGENT